ncbi:unnamed protein product [Hymenolepis diminuta]|uniref:DUF4097 domain-containing protein n=1 Tax=Hymenolepis diminuta TaxID=6216 RepID=A0A0R3SR77_HYMDI|nr:unnamed protein product [Hymenolepis diminuta]
MMKGLLTLRSLLLCVKRNLYVDVQPHSKLFIKGTSPLEVTCLPGCEADRCSVIVPDSGSFNVIDGCRIQQKSDPEVPITQLNVIQIPAKRELSIFQTGSHPISFVNYEGLKADIETEGPRKQVSDLSIRTHGDVTGSGYLEGNLKLDTTGGSFKADNITSQNIDIEFGGTDLFVHSAYCETMNLTWIVPPEPTDGVTPATLPPLSIYFGTLRGNANIEVAGDANFNIGSYEGSLYLRQRFGNVAVHIGGPCPLLQIDVAEGDVELSLPLSTVGERLSGAVEIQASKIIIDHEALPENCMDNWELGEAAEAETFFANFNNPSEDSEVLWRVRTLRGQIKLTGASWAEAMSRCIDRAAASLKT